MMQRRRVQPPGWRTRRIVVAGAAVAAVLLVALGTGLVLTHWNRPAGPTSAAGRPGQSPASEGAASPSMTRGVPAYDPALHNCGADPHVCGYPDATNTGVPSGMSLRSVPGQVSGGPGWHYDSRGWVEVDGNGAVLQGLSIPYNVDVSASNVTIKDVRITATGDEFGISLRNTRNVTVEDSTIFSASAGAERLLVGIKDIYGTCTGTKVLRNNIWHTSTGVQVYAGLIEDNYIHDMGYSAGDHLNGITSNGGTAPLAIQHNTVLNKYGQTDAISLFEDFGVEANVLITGNLMAGGGYTVYGGRIRAAGKRTTSG